MKKAVVLALCMLWAAPAIAQQEGDIAGVLQELLVKPDEKKESNAKLITPRARIDDSKEYNEYKDWQRRCPRYFSSRECRQKSFTQLLLDRKSDLEKQLDENERTIDDMERECGNKKRFKR